MAVLLGDRLERIAKLDDMYGFRMLVATNNLGTSESDRWLLDDLIDEFSGRGAHVDVVVNDIKRPRPAGVSRRSPSGEIVVSVGASKRVKGALDKIKSHIQAGVRLHTEAYRLLKQRDYDLCIFSSIGGFTWGLPSRLRKQGSVRKLVFILWDFFPVHQFEVGRLRRSWVTSLLKPLEYWSFKKADHIGLMSNANVEYFRRYHPSYRGDLFLLPPWAVAKQEGIEHVKQRSVFTCVFGGQLTKGRGVDTVIKAAEVLESRRENVEILIVGDGTLAAELRESARSSGISNVRFVGRLPRPEYWRLLESAHVGIAATVPGVSIPSFPSKIVEYASFSLPIVVCLEETTDVGDLLNDSGAGMSVAAGAHIELADALGSLLREHEQGSLNRRRKAAQRLFTDQLSVTRAADTLYEKAQTVTSSRSAGIRDS